MKSKLILTLCICISMVVLQGCGKPNTALDKAQGFKMVQELLPDEDSDLLYIYSSDTSNRDIWYYRCSLNGKNNIGEFGLGTYQIVRIYKEVGRHQLMCRYGGKSTEKGYIMDGRIIINAEGNKKHYVEINMGFMNVTDMKTVDGSGFHPDESYLTNNCTDCYHAAPKRFPKY